MWIQIDDTHKSAVLFFPTISYNIIMSFLPDSSGPGYFYSNTFDLPSRPIWKMEARTLHEVNMLDQATT